VVDEDVANDSVVVMHDVIEYLMGKRVMADFNHTICSNNVVGL
jgi:hypothetical protein